MADEMTVARGPQGEPQVRTVRAGAWTETQKRAFLAELAASANVKASAKAVGRSQAGAYLLRKRDEAFARAWDEAVCEGFGALELMMLQRAMKGRLKPMLYAGEVVTRVREYPDGMAMQLLTQHRATVARVRAEAQAALPAGVDGGEDGSARALLLAKLDAMAARLRGDEAIDPERPWDAVIEVAGAEAGDEGADRELGDG